MHQSRFPDQNTLHVFPSWFQWKISRMESPENAVWTSARERESGDWHDAVCWQTKSSLKWESNTQRCQFSCRTHDQPDYWLQQIKVIPEYQRRVHAGWPCRTPARWASGLRLRKCLQGGNGGSCLHLALYVWAAVCGSCGKGQERSTLGFIIRVQGSPLAPVISQICPKAANQCEGGEEGGNERTDGDTEMPRSGLDTRDGALKRGGKIKGCCLNFPQFFMQKKIIL